MQIKEYKWDKMMPLGLGEKVDLERMMWRKNSVIMFVGSIVLFLFANISVGVMLSTLFGRIITRSTYTKMDWYIGNSEEASSRPVI